MGKTGRLSIKKQGGMFAPKHFSGLDEQLVGRRAFSHPAVRRWWSWLMDEYNPPSQLLILPCSNVKPYTRSPTSAKVRGLLRRLGLIDSLRIAYFSDLLIIVPYERAEEYPACCYEVHPDVVLRSDLASLVTDTLATVMEKLRARGLELVITFLPKKHRKLWECAKKKANAWPEEVQVPYSILSLGELRKALMGLGNSK